MCPRPKFRVSLHFHTKKLTHFVSFSTLNQPEIVFLLGDPYLSLGERSFNCNAIAMSRWVRQTIRWVSGEALTGEWSRQTTL